MVSLTFLGPSSTVTYTSLPSSCPDWIVSVTFAYTSSRLGDSLKKISSKSSLRHTKSSSPSMCDTRYSTFSITGLDRWSPPGCIAELARPEKGILSLYVNLAWPCFPVLLNFRSLTVPGSPVLSSRHHMPFFRSCACIGMIRELRSVLGGYVLMLQSLKQPEAISLTVP